MSFTAVEIIFTVVLFLAAIKNIFYDQNISNQCAYLL